MESFSWTSYSGFLFIWSVSLPQPTLALFLSGEFFLHIPCLLFFCGEFLLHVAPFFVSFLSSLSLFLFFNVGSFTYTSHTGFIFIWGVSLTHPALASFLCGEFLLHIPCWLHFYGGSFTYFIYTFPGFFSFFFFFFFFFFNLRSFSYTSHTRFIFIWGVPHTHPVLPAFLSGEFLLHIPFLLYFCVGSFSYTSHSCFIFVWGVSLTHPMLAFSHSFSSSSSFIFYSGEFLLHIPCWLHFHPGSFSFTSHSCFIFVWGVSLTHPMLAYTSRTDFISIWGVSLTHPMLAFSHSFSLFFSSLFSFFFILGSFSYTSRAGFIFIWGVSLTHPMLSFFLPGEGGSFTHPMLAFSLF